MSVRNISEQEYKEIIRKFVLRILEEEFNGDDLDDEYFVQEICEITGMSRDTYMDIIGLTDKISVEDLAEKFWEVMNEQNTDELYEGYEYLKDILDNSEDMDIAIASLVEILNQKEKLPELKKWLERYCEIADRDDDWYYLCSIAKRIMYHLEWMMSEIKKDAEVWLANRRKELSSLRFRIYDTELWPEEKEILRKAGYFVYDLREWDDGTGYNIEVKVVVNHIGNWITDMNLTPYMNEGTWIGIDELYEAVLDSIPYEEIKHLLEEGRELHAKNTTASGEAIAF